MRRTYEIRFVGEACPVYATEMPETGGERFVAVTDIYGRRLIVNLGLVATITQREDL